MMKHPTYTFMPHKCLRSRPPRPTLKEHRRYAMTPPLAFALMVQRALRACEGRFPIRSYCNRTLLGKNRLKEQTVVRVMDIASTAIAYYLLFLHVD